MPIFNSVSRKKLIELKQWYSEQLKQKDKEIAELKSKNSALLKAALSQSQKLEDMRIKFESAVKKARKDKFS